MKLALRGTLASLAVGGLLVIGSVGSTYAAQPTTSPIAAESEPRSRAASAPTIPIEGRVPPIGIAAARVPSSSRVGTKTITAAPWDSSWGPAPARATGGRSGPARAPRPGLGTGRPALRPNGGGRDCARLPAGLARRATRTR